MAEPDDTWLLRNHFDRRMWETVYRDDEYGLPAKMDGMAVLDIGCNCGTFARLCAERGAKVLAVEPASDNHEVARENLKHRPSVILLKCAAGVDGGEAVLHKGDNPTAYSLLPVHWHNGAEVVKTFPLDTLAKDAMTLFGTDRIDLCKIDAEGAEYFLVPSYHFDPVRELVIEFHGDFVRDYEDRADECRKRLAGLGFREAEWREVHPDAGWLRIYKGVKA